MEKNKKKIEKDEGFRVAIKRLILTVSEKKKIRNALIDLMEKNPIREKRSSGGKI